jgi:hypothetical protein
VLVTILALLLLSSCSDTKLDRPAAPAPPPQIEVAMKEFRYSQSARAIPAGRVVFRLDNEGKQPHQPDLLILPDDLPPILEQLRGSVRRTIPSLVNNPGQSPGIDSAITVDLEAGRRYAFVCHAKTPQGEDHSRLGMAWEFRAGAAP